MKKPTFSIAHEDEEMVDLVSVTDHKIVAAWAIDCAARVLPHFEELYSHDRRPRHALETLQTWLNTGVFQMSVIRKASLDSHAAAREVGEDNAARSAARSCGQAVATAHVSSHAYGSAIYAQQSIFRTTDPIQAAAAVDKERDWQYQHLLDLRESS